MTPTAPELDSHVSSQPGSHGQARRWQEQSGKGWEGPHQQQVGPGRPGQCVCLMWKTHSTSVPSWISHTWISPGSDPHPPGMWVLGHGHTPGRGLSPKQPRGWFGVCSRVDTQSRLVGHRLSPCSFGQEKALGCGVWLEPDLDTACSLQS